MNIYCNEIVLSRKAYNTIHNETYKKIDTETGGILLGHVIDRIWYIMEVIEPGPASIFHSAYFEYDTDYVNKRAREVATLYKIELSLLGLWHRHPGSFDRFSQTDDATNLTFSKLSKHGAISGLVNLMPNFQLKIFHVFNISNQPKYELIKHFINDENIPKELFEHKTTMLHKNEILQTVNPSNAHISIPILKIDDKNLQNEEKQLEENQIQQNNTIKSNYSTSIKEEKKISLWIRIKNFFVGDSTTILSINNEPYSDKDKEKNKTEKKEEPSEEEQKLYNILMREEELLLRQDIYDYETEIINNKIVYKNRIKDLKLPYPRLITFQLILDLNHLTFITDSYGQYQFREGIFYDYLICKAKDKFFNG